MKFDARHVQGLIFSAADRIAGPVGSLPDENHNACMYPISQVAKSYQATLTRRDQIGGIFERPVKSDRVAGELGAELTRSVTDGDHEIESLPRELFQ